MRTAAFFARLGKRILNNVTALLVLLMLLYGGYSLWDTWQILQGGFTADSLLALKPAVTAEASEDSPTFEDLLALNPDVRAWITIDDTHIDHPVLQGEDDMEYVNKNVYGEFELSGAIFVSSQNAPDFTDSYILTYGHHMSNGGMYGDVEKFLDASFFEEHTTGTLILPDRVYGIELFASMEVNAFDGQIFDPDKRGEWVMKNFLEYVEKNAVHYRPIGVTAQDQVISLTTCSDISTNGRFILLGRLVAETEKETETQAENSK